MINKDFYLITILDKNNALVESLLCFVPDHSWVRLTNVQGYSYAHGRDEYEIGELYQASSTENFVNRMAPMIYPRDLNPTDGNGTNPQPQFVTRNIGNDIPGMKAYGYGWLTYQLRLPTGTYPGWVTAHAYTSADNVQVTITDTFRADRPAYFHCTTNGTSGGTEPTWSLAPNNGDTINDGTAVWTNITPYVTMSYQKDMGRWRSKTDTPTLPTTGFYASGDNDFMDRRRFNIFCDTQAMWVKVQATGPIADFQIQQLEAEERSYWFSADSRGA
jgi:hypothetical protein